MSVIASDPYIDESPDSGVRLVSLDEVWSGSDVISLHAPATIETRHLVDELAIATMKPSAFLVNSRAAPSSTTTRCSPRSNRADSRALPST